MRAIFLNEKNRISQVFTDAVINQISDICDIDKNVYTKQDVISDPDKFKDAEIVFSTWGMSVFTNDEVKTLLPSLKAIFYAAGTVQYFAKPFLQNGVRVFSAWAANAVPVAEYTVSQILLANKGFFRTLKMEYGDAKALSRTVIGNYDAKIGIIGAGMIGSLVCEMLKAYKLEVMVFDPFLSDEKAKALGVSKVSLEKLFSECNVVSNHLANNEQTKGMLGLSLFEKMPQGATFINTGRGAQVVEADLADALIQRPDLTALLDVTDPEPPEPQSKLLCLDNCIITPHIAGSLGQEVYRMSEYMKDELCRYVNGECVKYEVTEKMLETMA